MQKLYPDAQLPTKAYACDAGWDLYAAEDVRVHSYKINSNMFTVRTGIAVAIPEGYYGQVLCRSGLGSKGLRVHPGVIDSGYRGELLIFVQHTTSDPALLKINKGDRVAQLIILPVPDAVLKEVMQLPSSDRGIRGGGSSGL